MNVIQFIGQTHSGPLTSIEDVVHYFDHMMAAYASVRSFEINNVCGSPDNFQSALKLSVFAPTVSELEGVEDYVNNTIHNRCNLYGKNFTLQASIEDGPCLQMFVREEAKLYS